MRMGNNRNTQAGNLRETGYISQCSLTCLLKLGGRQSEVC
jgi:hypothetical protein